MRRFSPTMVIALIAALSFSSTVFAQGEPNDQIEALKRENWKLKKILIGLPEKDVGLGRHALNFGMNLAPASDQVAKPLGLKKGNGLYVESVDGPSAKVSGIEPGDIITRLKLPSGDWEEASLGVLERSFLPGDLATFEVCRGMRRIEAPIPVLCSCNKGRDCPFFSPFAPPPPPQRDKLHKAELLKKAQEMILALKPLGKKWSDLAPEDLRTIEAKAGLMGLTEGEAGELVRKVWREQCVAEQQLPDDPAERWKKMTGAKFEKLRAINLKDKEGVLSAPEVQVWEDAGMTRTAGKMNHDEWVEVIESKGDMTKVVRRRDKKEAWIETRYLKEIYTKEDIEKGPTSPKKEGDKDGGKGVDEWD